MARSVLAVPPLAAGYLYVRALEMHLLPARVPLVAALVSTLRMANACAEDPSAQPSRRQMAPYTVTLELGKPAVIPQEALNVELLEVKDNRCAVEVQCVWAGHAEVTLRVSKARTAAQALVIGTLAPASMKLPFEATYGSYRFALLGLEPGNSLSKPVAQSAYRATVQVSNL